jgi:hypothetical protein
MAQTRLNRKGKVIPKNANQRKEQKQVPSKRFRKAADHDTKKRPRNY